MGRRSVLAGLAVSLTLASLAVVPGTASAHTAPHQDQYKRVGYFIQWGIYGRQYYVKNLETSGQAKSLTHINYAFGNVDATGRCASADPWADYQRPVSAEESDDGVADAPGQPLNGNFNQLRKLKLAHPDLKIEISLGGWTKSTWFAQLAALPG